MNEPAMVVFIFLSAFLLVVTTLLLPLGLDLDPAFVAMLSAGLAIVVWTSLPESTDRNSVPHD